jgi:hypothetical protein
MIGKAHRSDAFYLVHSADQIDFSVDAVGFDYRDDPVIGKDAVHLDPGEASYLLGNACAASRRASNHNP